MAESPGNRQPSGHDEEFVSEFEDDFQCLICHLLLKEPVLTRCGHRFCKGCMEEHLRRQQVQAQPFTCPADRVRLDRDRDVFPDKATERKVLSLAIKCSSEDCDWTGELRNKEIHLKSCPFQVVSCTHKNCHVTLKMKDLEKHVITCEWRTIECEYCREPQPVCCIQSLCVHCKCKRLTAAFVQVHIGKCRKFPLNCPNNCGDSIPREMIPHHMEHDCPQALVCCPYVQMGCQEKLVRRENLESHLQSATREHLDFLEKKVESLQKQLEQKGNRDVVLMKKTAENTQLFIWKINECSKMISQAKAGEKAKIESEPFYTERYGYKLKVAVHGNGSGLGKNTHLSVFIVVMKGDYDAILPWPFNKKVKLMLIDQHEDPAKRENVECFFIANKEPFSMRPRGEENTGYGKPRFISHEQLQARRYLVDDTVFLQVEIGSPYCPVSRSHSCSS